MQHLKTFLAVDGTSTIQPCHSWLLLGGTGTISTGVMHYLRPNHAVTCLNRGNTPLPIGVEQLVCDVNDAPALSKVLAGRTFDVVVDFLTYTPEQAEARVKSFAGKCNRYVFISTAMTYEKPPKTLLISERTPQFNPYSDYARQKIRCEGVFRAAYKQQGFPLTIIRPSWTYGDWQLPLVLCPKNSPWTLLKRLRDGRPIVIPGDGSVFWTITHNSDFARGLAGLVENTETLGEDFHITQDECMTWDAYAQALAKEAGAPSPIIVHIASDRLIEEEPTLLGTLKGDKGQTAVFDNSKMRKFLPGFRFLMPYRDGVKRVITNLDKTPSRQVIDEAWDAWMDEMIRKHG